MRVVELLELPCHLGVVEPDRDLDLWKASADLDGELRSGHHPMLPGLRPGWRRSSWRWRRRLLASVVLTSGQRALLEQAPLAHLSGCEPQPTVESATTSAALGCERDYPGGDGLLLRQSTPGQALASAWTATRGGSATAPLRSASTTAGPAGRCPATTTTAASRRCGGAVVRDSGLNQVAMRNGHDNGELYA